MCHPSAQAPPGSVAVAGRLSDTWRLVQTARFASATCTRRGRRVEHLYDTLLGGVIHPLDDHQCEIIFERQRPGEMGGAF